MFIHHTSASLVIPENASPDVPRPRALPARLVPEDDLLYPLREGPDDMPSHVERR